MRIIPSLFAAVLCAASIGAAHAQQSTASGAGKASASLPAGMSFAYDAQHGVISTTGIRLKTTTLKSSSTPTTEGVIKVTILINVDSKFESGTTYHCSVYVLGGIIDTDNSTIDGGIENANTFATSSGGKYACTFKIPYEWTLPADSGADSGLIVAFGVAAVNPQSEVEHSTLQIDGIENLPANGATSNFMFHVAL